MTDQRTARIEQRAAVALVLAALVLNTDATAQSARTYRLIDLGQIAPDVSALASLDLPGATTLPGDHENTLGLNDSGEVVGGFFVAPSGPVHAFLWVPVPAYGLPAGRTDLHGLAFGPGDSESSFANDLNEQGRIVGEKGGDVSLAAHAHAWFLGVTVVPQEALLILGLPIEAIDGFVAEATSEQIDAVGLFVSAYVADGLALEGGAQ